MKIKTIEITNFRCFESLVLTLDPVINVIVGINGAGKTSILDAIALALYDIIDAGCGTSRNTQSAELRSTDIRIDPGASDEAIGRREFVHIKAAVEDFHPLPDFPSHAPNGQTMALEWENHIHYQPPRGFHYAREDYRNQPSITKYIKSIWKALRESNGTDLIPLPAVAYYRAERFINRMPDLQDVLKKNISRQGAYQNTLNAGADYRSLCQWFYLRENNELRDRLKRQNGQDFECSDLRAVRRAVMTTIENVTRIFFDGTPPRLKFAITDPKYGEMPLEIEQMSDGYRNLLALVMDFARRLAQANPNWPNPLEAPGILLIDEIELHLHPKWQQTIIPKLHAAFPNTQIIAATHSPEVLTTVRRENILLLGLDHGIEPVPGDVGTYGAESSRVLEEVFSAHARPPAPDVPTAAQLRDYLRLVEARKQDSPKGLELRAEIEKALGPSDPDLLAADARIHQLQTQHGK